MHPFNRSTPARATTVLAAATLLVAGGLAEAGAAQARVAPRTVVAGGLVSPLTAGVRANGTAYISENFAGLLAKQRPGHKPRVVYHAPKGVEVGGVTAGARTVTFTLTKGAGPEAPATQSLVMHLRGGKATRFANTGRFERNVNPDAGVTYGFRDVRKRCLAKVPKRIPAHYTGVVDTHPYSTAVAGSTTYVGDAAGNDILRIGPSGHIKSIKVLPPVGLRVTAKRAKLNELPRCTIGHKYFFEPVPTDVEVDGSGDLVVTTLTGATEVPGFGGQSRVYTLHPNGSGLTMVASHLAGAVGVAIAGKGSYLVSQLNADQVSRVDAGTGAVSRYRKVHQPAAVERVGGKVYVTAGVLAQKPVGRLLRFGG